MLHQGINQFGTTMLAAAVAAVAYLLVILGFENLVDVAGGHEAATSPRSCSSSRASPS
ncbi:hypothetical protein NKG05_09980 [Oerskovia sp. M15]